MLTGCIPSYRYLLAVLNETQRLTPLAPFAARYSEKDMILGGYTVKANVRYDKSLQHMDVMPLNKFVVA